MEERHSEAGMGDGLRPAQRPQTAPASASADDGPGPITPLEGPLGPRGDLYRNFGDGYTRAFELAVTPAIFGFLGYLLDSWFGIVPLFTVVFALVALVTLMARTWNGYCRRMQVLEQAGPWANRPTAPPGVAQ